MAVYIQATTDAFAERFEKMKAQPSSYANVRRPLRGIQVKPNTYAQICVKTATGGDINLFDSSAPAGQVVDGVGKSNQYANFIIQGYSEQRAEKQQIIQTFGDDFVFFFGEQPRYLDFRGMLVNTADFNWKSEFWTNYDLYLRGTKLVEQNARIYLYFDDVVVEGYMVAARTGGDAQSPHLMPFNFQLYVTHYAIVSSVGSVYFQNEKDMLGKYGKTVDGLVPILPPAGNPAPPPPGGLRGFVNSVNAGFAKAQFAVQDTLENVKNFLHATPLVLPENLAGMNDGDRVRTGSVNYGKAPVGRPIHEMYDEYVEKPPAGLSAQAKAAFLAQQAKLQAQLALTSPEGFSEKARLTFKAYGIDVGGPSTAMLLLGKGAFAAIQFAAPYGLRKIPKSQGGRLGQADSAVGTALTPGLI